MEAAMFIEYRELLQIADSQQRDGLIRWLDREDIPYLIDAKGKPRVLKSEIADRVQKKGIVQRKGA
jgi:hypothetical protein